MELHNLVKITARSKKRLGRGLGSGKGKTVGRGTKGQKARGKIPTSFIGGTLPLYKKLPLKRGQGNPKLSVNAKVLDIEKLDVFKAGSVVDLSGLVEQGLVLQKEILKSGVKILGKGNLSKALTVKLPVSSSARKKIESVGGKVESV